MSDAELLAVAESEENVKEVEETSKIMSVTEVFAAVRSRWCTSKKK